MRVIHRDVRRDRSGEIKLLAESLDDLWHLKHLISGGDLVFAVTFRKVETATDKVRPDKAVRKPMRLGVRVEKVEFHHFANRLRIHGTIESGTDIGSHHTINIESGDNVSIVKGYWRGDQLQRVDDAVRASRQPRVLILTIEDGLAVAGVVQHFGVVEVFTITGGSGKMERSSGDPRASFLREVASQLGASSREMDTMIVAGPGFVKNDFMKVLKETNPEIADKTVVDDITSVGQAGFQEVLRRDAFEHVVEGARIAREAKLFEDFMKGVATDGAVEYGADGVRSAVKAGAVDTLMIVDELLRSDECGELEILMDSVERSRGKVIVFSSEFEPGIRLNSMGGIAALLRFKIS